jgi:hypothetical protein
MRKMLTKLAVIETLSEITSQALTFCDAITFCRAFQPEHRPGSVLPINQA